MPRHIASATVLLIAALGTSARAASEDAEPGAADAEVPNPAPADDQDTPDAPPAATRPPSADGRSAVDIYPPPVEGPALRLPEPRTRVYLDGAYGITNDLSALPYIEGRGRNVRGALGATWRWRRLALEGQVPVNLTMIEVPRLLNQDTMERDRHQTGLSLGDIALGMVWTGRINGDSEALIAGVGLRGRLATHTTRFTFHLNDGTLATFTIPYYFHIEPTLILGGALGPFTYVINQGAIWLLGPDGYIQDTPVIVPSIYFWDAHYAIGLAPWSFLGASVEVATTIQLNHIPGANYTKFNDIRAVWVAPAVQIHLGELYRIDLIARLGLTYGEELYGAVEFVGTHSFTLRVTRAF